ncbi:hypothetical protein GCM10022225_02880 [Plantactinospora mayteni]|uniref:Uncharacterized protein n=1 Tax=Plantactinospora mayteni TaxID=566021 RepID=A0ABQ4EQ49_9ACTN|nr:hypothetical protein [Plantactinospora mayteni]GIG96776.1 hypothetical protein Pma05_33490 [Plantactinospora mayteni]
MTQPPPVPSGQGLDALAPPPPAPPRRDPLAPPPPWTGPPTVILRYAEVDTAVLPVVEPGPPPAATPAAPPPHPSTAPWPVPTATPPASFRTAPPNPPTVLPAALAATSPEPGTPLAEPGTAAPAAPEGAGSGQVGWWRRNRWGLLALLPALVLALGPGVKDGYEQYSQAEYLEPVGVGADGWVEFAAARIRLVELVEVPSVPARGSRQVTLPEGVRVWRATLAFELPDPEALIGCLPYLEDRDGRLFSANPPELNGARLPVTRCAADDPAQRSLQTEAYFVLPGPATPAALRIVKATQRPRYARLPVG